MTGNPDTTPSFHPYLGCEFTEVPEVLGSMPSLYMLSFKSCALTDVSERALSPSVGWLILTDNRLSSLPSSIGNLRGLRKCMLSGNCLEALPVEMAKCRELELLRISCNDFQELPSWLMTLPRLSWLATAGNPCSELPPRGMEVPEVEYKDVEVEDEVLGEGTSGAVRKAMWQGQEVAMKFFKSAATSDGSPKDEMRVCPWPSRCPAP